MATDLDGIFNVGLKGCRDRKIFDSWLEELKKIDLPKAKYPKDNGVYVEELGEWEYEIGGFGGDDPSEDEEAFPYCVMFDGPYMMKIKLMDDIAEIPTFYRLSILFEQPDFFYDFIKDVHKILKVFGATELIWLSSLGSASYSGVYQNEVWENVPFEKVKESLVKEIGQAISYAEAKKYDEEISWEYKTLDKFVLDTL